MKLVPEQEKMVVAGLKKLRGEKWDDDESYGYPLGRHTTFEMKGAKSGWLTDSNLEKAINAAIKQLASKAGIRLDPKGDIYSQVDESEVTIYQFASKLPKGDKMLEDIPRQLETAEDFAEALAEVRAFEIGEINEVTLTEGKDPAIEAYNLLSKHKFLGSMVQKAGMELVKTFENEARIVDNHKRWGGQHLAAVDHLPNVLEAAKKYERFAQNIVAQIEDVLKAAKGR